MNTLQEIRDKLMELVILVDTELGEQARPQYGLKMGQSFTARKGANPLATALVRGYVRDIGFGRPEYVVTYLGHGVTEVLTSLKDFYNISPVKNA